MTWKIWLTRNKDIFEDCKPDIKYIVQNILDQLHLHPMATQPKLKRRNTSIVPVFDYLASFFDGESANKMGGFGVHILIIQDHY